MVSFFVPLFPPRREYEMDLTVAVLAFVETVTVIVSVPVRPPESVVEAVTVWTPSRSTFEKLPPVPMAPSRFEVQARLDVRLPSSRSFAEPWKTTATPGSKVSPLLGAEMVTWGALLTGPELAASSASTMPNPYSSSQPAAPRSSAVFTSRWRAPTFVRRAPTREAGAPRTGGG